MEYYLTVRKDEIMLIIIIWRKVDGTENQVK
jgi:hypothetical protein